MLHARTNKVLSFALLLAAVPTIPACTVFSTGRGVQAAADREPASSGRAEGDHPSRTIKAAPPDGDTLAAIEDFLARTSKYKALDAMSDTDKPAAFSGQNERPQSTAVEAGVVDPAPSRRDRMVNQMVTHRDVGDTDASRHRSDDAARPSPQGAPAMRAAAPQQQWIDARQIPDAAADPVATNAPVSASGSGSLALPVLLSVSVRAAPPPVADPAGGHGSSNVPVEVVSTSPSVTWDTLVEALRQQPDARTSIRTIWQLALAELASNPAELPRLEVEGHPAETVSLLQALWAATAAVRDLLVDPVGAGDDAQARVEALARAVAQHADPKIENIHLCRRVTTFGVYEEMEPGDIVAGRPAQTIIYSELDNLRSKELPDGGFETQLATRMELLTPKGESVWSHDEPQIIDRCRRQRRDFFLAQRITLPATLPAGQYVLKLRVEDLRSRRTVESVRDVEVSSELALARRPSPQP